MGPSWRRGRLTVPRGEARSPTLRMVHAVPGPGGPGAFPFMHAGAGSTTRCGRTAHSATGHPPRKRCCPLNRAPLRCARLTTVGVT
jgi:hypothetical protein